MAPRRGILLPAALALLTLLGLLAAMGAFGRTVGWRAAVAAAAEAELLGATAQGRFLVLGQGVLDSVVPAGGQRRAEVGMDGHQVRWTLLSVGAHAWIATLEVQGRAGGAMVREVALIRGRSGALAPRAETPWARWGGGG